MTTAKTLVGLAGTVSSFAMIEQGLAGLRPRPGPPLPAHEGRRRGRVPDAGAPSRPPIGAHNPGLEPGRVDVIVGGAIILVTVLRTFGFDELLTSESDILDGLVRDMTVR